MESQERGLFIYRPVSADSLPKLRKLQAKYADVETFRPVDTLHLTLLQGNVLPHIYGKSRMDIIEAAPETAEEPYDMEVVSSRFHRGSYGMSRFAIALLLSDKDGQYHDEQRIFRGLAAKKSDKVDSFISREPHITLGYLSPNFALKSVLDVAEGLNGQAIGLDPAESNIGKVTRKRNPQTVYDLTHTLVRTVIPGSIPSNFLASLNKDISGTEAQ